MAFISRLILVVVYSKETRLHLHNFSIGGSTERPSRFETALHRFVSVDGNMPKDGLDICADGIGWPFSALTTTSRHDSRKSPHIKGETKCIPSWGVMHGAVQNG